MKPINNFYEGKRVKLGHTFSIYDWEDKISITQILQVGSVRRGDHHAKLVKMICLTSALPYGNEIEVQDAFNYPSPKKLPSNRIIRKKHDVFTLTDIKWLLGIDETFPEDSIVYSMDKFSWTFNYHVQNIQRYIRLDRGLEEVDKLQAQFKSLLQIDDSEDSK